MSAASILSNVAASNRRTGAGIRFGLYPMVAVLGISFLSGCMAGRDHVIVGAIPDDYRTNHPITISEKEQVTDIPVGASDRGMTRAQRQQLEGFLDNYDRSAMPVLRILLPTGSANQAAARRAAAGLAEVAREAGVPRGHVSILSYQAGAPDSQPPIRVSYSKVVASAGPCGRWPEDLMRNAENKHYADFGCSYQRNLAAQVADPNDLIGPRKEGDIDAARRQIVISGADGAGGWRGSGSPDLSGDVQY